MEETPTLAQQKIGAADTVYAITKTKERYNLDQDLYMWYFREMLVLPDVRAAMEKKAEAKENAPATKKEKKGIAGFFKNLFFSFFVHFMLFICYNLYTDSGIALL